MTKLGGPKRIHVVRARGGNLKYRALRLDSGNFSWGGEGASARAVGCAERACPRTSGTRGGGCALDAPRPPPPPPPRPLARSRHQEDAHS